MDLQRFQFIEATVRLRRGEGWDVKPEAEALDGKTVELQVAWAIGDGDPERYRGEWACMSPNMAQNDLRPLGWIASGDLADIRPL